VKHLVEAEYEGDQLVPVRCRSCAVETFPFVAEDATDFLAYARADLHDLFPKPLLDEALERRVDTLESGWLANDGQGHFEWQALPRLAQLSPGFGIVLEDLDGNGTVDIVLAQNFHGPQAETGRFDGGLGQVLLGDGNGGFDAVPPWRSGLVVPGDGKSLVATDLNDDNWTDLMLGVNDDRLRAFFNLRSPGGSMLSVDLRGPPGNPTAVGARVTLQHGRGRREAAEVTAGGGYLSQQLPTLRFGLGERHGPYKLRVRWPDGRVTRHELPAGSERVVLEPQPSSGR